MAETVEITLLDTRYEDYRLRSPAAEKLLLCSIQSNGIRDPLQGVNVKDRLILLDGFKRYRCAKVLHKSIVPYRSLGTDEAEGILEIIRISNSKSLSILEQARLINELRNVYKMTTADIACKLEKSNAWVSVRQGLINEMSKTITDKLFKGEFPTYSYMYTMRHFMRIKGIGQKDVDEFVRAVSGKHLSIRDIEILAHGYFKGGEDIREQIRRGNIPWSLSRLKQCERTGQGGCNEAEQAMIRDLEITQKYMSRIICKSKDQRYKTASFFAQANLLAGGIVRQMGSFNQAIKEFYDTTGQKSGNLQSA